MIYITEIQDRRIELEERIEDLQDQLSRMEEIEDDIAGHIADAASELAEARVRIIDNASSEIADLLQDMDVCEFEINCEVADAITQESENY